MQIETVSNMYFKVALVSLSLLHAASRVSSSNYEVIWYKPHYQCNGYDGSTPKQAASFINSYLSSDSKADFVGISEWEMSDSVTIGNPSVYGSIGSVCGYSITSFTAPVVLFYRRDKWDLITSYPSSSSCRDMVPVPNSTGSWTGPLIGPICVDKVVPGNDTCCSCTFTVDEYDFGNTMNQNTGQRPWAAGLFNLKQTEGTGEDIKVCAVVAEFPHPLANVTLWDLNGEATSDPQPFSIMRYICTSLLGQSMCVPNENGTSIIFGTAEFTQGVSDFCGDVPLLFMMDTNIGAGDFFTAALFLDFPFTEIQGVGGVTGLSPYTCCNETDTMTSPFVGEGYNRYASDRIAVSGGFLNVDVLEGGSSAPGGPLPDDLSYQCHSAEEHAPIRAFITDTRIPVIQTGASLSLDPKKSFSFYVTTIATLISLMKAI